MFERNPFVRFVSVPLKYKRDIIRVLDQVVVGSKACGETYPIASCCVRCYLLGR